MKKESIKITGKIMNIYSLERKTKTMIKQRIRIMTLRGESIILSFTNEKLRLLLNFYEGDTINVEYLPYARKASNNLEWSDNFVISAEKYIPEINDESVRLNNWFNSKDCPVFHRKMLAEVARMFGEEYTGYPINE